MYAAGFLLVMGITALFDGGQFASMYLLGGKLSKEMLTKLTFKPPPGWACCSTSRYPCCFGMRPALVHWHGVPPSKALFFSLVACLRNLGAYTVYGLLWMAVFGLAGVVAVSLMALLGLGAAAGVVMVPLALTMAAMFFSSIYFTFRDSFVHDEPTDTGVAPAA